LAKSRSRARLLSVCVFGHYIILCQGIPRISLTHISFVDALFDECRGQQDILTSHLSWYNISESDADSSGDEMSNGSDVSMSGGEFDEDDFEMGYDRLSDMSELAMYINRVPTELQGAVDEAESMDETEEAR
jgi:hypothetical protein